MSADPINVGAMGRQLAREVLASEALQPEAWRGQPPVSSGSFAQGLMQCQIRRLAKLQAEVLADRDPEPLHRMRVSLRRLRTVLVQFAAALELPERVRAQRIAAVARRTSRCRDLDVLRLRLEQQLLPRIPHDEQRHLDGAIKRLARERRKAFTTLQQGLRSARYRTLLERLNDWQKQPRFTPLGQLPLLPWLVDWQAPFSAGLFLHRGWTEEDPAAPNLHGLRKRIKDTRYSLENLQPWCHPPLRAWIDDLRQAQDHLGELHDLQILQHTLVTSIKRRKRGDLPGLQAELQGQQQLHWWRWRELAQRLHSDHGRHTVQQQLLQLGRTSLQAGG